MQVPPSMAEAAKLVLDLERQDAALNPQELVVPDEIMELLPPPTPEWQAQVRNLPPGA